MAGKGMFFPRGAGHGCVWALSGPMSPLRVLISDEVPRVGASCSSGPLHTGPGPRSGKGGCRAGTSQEWSGSSSGRRCARMVLPVSSRISACLGGGVVPAPSLSLHMARERHRGTLPETQVLLLPGKELVPIIECEALMMWVVILFLLQKDYADKSFGSRYSFPFVPRAF